MLSGLISIIKLIGPGANQEIHKRYTSGWVYEDISGGLIKGIRHPPPQEKEKRAWRCLCVDPRMGDTFHSDSGLREKLVCLHFFLMLASARTGSFSLPKWAEDQCLSRAPPGLQLQVRTEEACNFTDWMATTSSYGEDIVGRAACAM